MLHALPADSGRLLSYNTWPMRSVHETGSTQSLSPPSLSQDTSGRARPLALIRSAGKTAQADAQVCCVDVASPHMRRSLCRGSWQSSGGVLSESLPESYPAESHNMRRRGKVMDRALCPRCLLTAIKHAQQGLLHLFPGFFWPHT